MSRHSRSGTRDFTPRERARADRAPDAEARIARSAGTEHPLVRRDRGGARLHRAPDRGDARVARDAGQRAARVVVVETRVVVEHRPPQRARPRPPHAARSVRRRDQRQLHGGQEHEPQRPERDREFDHHNAARAAPATAIPWRAARITVRSRAPRARAAATRAQHRGPSRIAVIVSACGSGARVSALFPICNATPSAASKRRRRTAKHPRRRVRSRMRELNLEAGAHAA